MQTNTRFSVTPAPTNNDNLQFSSEEKSNTEDYCLKRSIQEHINESFRYSPIQMERLHHSPSSVHLDADGIVGKAHEILPTSILSGFSKRFNYSLLLLSPIYAAMAVIGFQYRNKCQVDVSIPHYLFFGGICGLIAISMRLLMLFTWKFMQHHYDKGYNPEDYPGFQMVRCIMYLSIGIVFVWNGRITSNVLAIQPDSIDEPSMSCHATVYKFAFILVIFFNVIFFTAILVWLASIVSVICFEDLMSDYYYENDIVPPNIHFKKPFWLKEDKNENSDKEKEFKDKCEDNGDKLPIPPNTPISQSMKVPFHEDEFKDRLIILREDLRNNIRNGKERGGRKRRSLSTSFSFLSENSRGIEMDLNVGKQSHIIGQTIQENTAVGIETPSTLYVPVTNDGSRNSSKSIDKLDGARDESTLEDNESVSSMEYYNTTTSQVRFAIDLDVNHDQTDSDDERWSWDKEDPESLERTDETNNVEYRERKPHENINNSPPRSGRFSVTKCPQIESSTLSDNLAMNGNDSSYEKGQEYIAIQNGVQNNNEPQILKTSEKPPIALNRNFDTKENAPKSSSSRFSVQSVEENGSSNRLPIITEDVSFA